MKNNLYIIFVNVLIFNLVCTILNGVTLPVNLVYLLLCYLLIGFLMLMNSFILRFFTIKVNFLTQFVMIALLTAGAIYLLNLLIPEFKVIGYQVSSKQFEFIVVQSTTLSFAGTIALYSVVNGLLGAFFESFKGER